MGTAALFITAALTGSIVNWGSPVGLYSPPEEARDLVPRTRPSPTPQPTPPRDPVALPTEGTFVLYSSYQRGGAGIFAIDVGRARKAHGDYEPLFLGRQQSDIYGAAPIRGNGRVLGIQYSQQSIALISHGWRLGDHVIRFRAYLRAAATSEDGQWMAIATGNDRHQSRATITLHRIDGSSPPRLLKRIRTSSDLYGGALDLFWIGSGSLAIVDRCHCDGGAGWTTTQILSLDGELQDVEVVDGHSFSNPGSQHLGPILPFDNDVVVDCFEHPRICRRERYKIALVNVETGSAEHLLENIRPWPTPLSPSRTFLATRGRERADREIRIYEVASGKVVATGTFYAASLTPLDWLNERDLIAVATSPDLVDDRLTGRLVLFERRPPETYIQEPVGLASGTDIAYHGWVR